MTVALLVMTDGRDGYLGPCLASVADYVRDAPISEWWMHDDTGDPDVRKALTVRWPHFRQIGGGPRRGFGGAISWAWTVLTAYSQARYVLHVEQDFVFTRPVDVPAMAAVLDARPYLTQMALRRQPWNRAEHAAGGVVEQHPADYTEVTDGGHVWLEHTRFWTTNPSLYPRSLCSRGWPDGLESEGRFGIALFGQDPAARAGFWGARGDGPWVEHIGHERVGVGY